MKNSSKIKLGRIPDAYRLVKSMTEAEARFHKNFRAILRRRSERSDKLFEEFLTLKKYNPTILVKMMGSGYTPHRAALLLRTLKEQLLHSIKVYHETYRSDLNAQCRKAYEIIETERLHPTSTPESVLSLKADSHVTDEKLVSSEAKSNQNTSINKSKVQKEKVKYDTSLLSFIQISQEEEQKLSELYLKVLSGLTNPGLTPEEKKKLKRLKKIVAWLQEGKPEKILKKLPQLNEKGGLAPQLSEILRIKTIQKIATSLSEGNLSEALVVYQKANQNGIQLEVIKPALSSHLQKAVS